MRGWIYAVQLSPSGRIKLGMTEKLTRRLTSHIASAEFSGGSVARVFSMAVSDAVVAERDLLTLAADHPKSVLVHGRETFAGLTFAQAVLIAEEVGKRHGTELWAPLTDDLVGKCMAAMDEDGLRRVSLDRLRVLLGDHAPGTNAELGRALRKVGVIPMTVWCPYQKRDRTGIKREMLVSPAAA